MSFMERIHNQPANEDDIQQPKTLTAHTGAFRLKMKSVCSLRRCDKLHKAHEDKNKQTNKKLAAQTNCQSFL